MRIVDIIKQAGKEVDQYLHGLNDKKISALFVLIQDMYNLQNVQLSVDPAQKFIEIRVFIDDKEIILKPKTDILDKIKQSLGLQEWQIEFAKVKQDGPKLKIVNNTKPT